MKNKFISIEFFMVKEIIQVYLRINFNINDISRGHMLSFFYNTHYNIENTCKLHAYIINGII